MRRMLVVLAAMMVAMGWTVGGSPAVAAPADHNHTDVMFAMHMIPHHQQAIDMSDIVLAKANIDPGVVDLANRINAAQAPEIVQMQGWLEDWGLGGMCAGMDTTSGGMGPGMGPGAGPMMPDTGGMGMGGMGMGGMGMGGMASESQMGALRAAEGVAASRLYLDLMIPHHQGGIAMAQNEIDNGQFEAETALGRSIVASQQREIGEMQTLRAAL